MKRTIEITASFTGKIPTGSYENESPFYALKETIEFDDEGGYNDTAIKERQQQLHDLCYQQFKQHAEVAYSERIAKEYRNIRFYPGENGTKYPSVTSILSWDADFFMSPDELQQHASRGSIIDKQVELYLKDLMEGKEPVWREPEAIPEIYPDLVIIKGGNLKLALDDSNFVDFFKKYPFKPLALQGVLINHEHRYGGRKDIKCVIESSNKGCWDKVEGVLFDVPSILDVKAGAMDKTKFLKQQTAYWHCDPEIMQVGIIHLNKETQQGFSKPTIETNREKYWSLFLRDRSNFKNRYGI
jgi:hypothetical protein